MLHDLRPLGRKLAAHNGARARDYNLGTDIFNMSLDV
jgi:hypothetical protein